MDANNERSVDYINVLDAIGSDILNDNSIESEELAEEYTLDIPKIPSIEVPLYIKPEKSSMHKVLRMCGGIDKIKQVLTSYDDTQQYLELYLNEGYDRNGIKSFFNEHSIVGKKVPYRDESILLKVTLPKGTLAKYNNNISKAIAALKNNEANIVPISIINNTYKFREMSDFQIRLDNSPAAEEYKNTFGSLNWNKFKSFVASVPNDDPRPYENINNIIIDRNRSAPNSDFQLPPPPRLSTINYPLQYKYKTNPFATKTSNGITKVKGTYIKNYQLLVHDLSPETKIPTEPHPNLKADYQSAKSKGLYPGTKNDLKFYESLNECLAILERLFSDRPIWVKKHIDGIIPKSIYHTLKIALALVSYRFTMGPWRNTYIKFGIDPRTSNEYGKYQTEYFKIERKLLKSQLVSKNIPAPPDPIFESDNPGGIDSRFKFDGKQVPWYLMLQIDLLLEEPNIAEVFAKAEYLNEVNEVTGWFKELDLTKIRRIVKYELGCMVQGNFDFNVYKLKYFRTMLYAKESMMNSENKLDEDGDTKMDSEDARNLAIASEIKSDDENDITTGEPDEIVLEAEEVDDDANVEDDDDADDEESSNFQNLLNVESASFQDVIDRIRKFDPSVASRLNEQLEGLVQESKLHQ